MASKLRGSRRTSNAKTKAPQKSIRELPEFPELHVTRTRAKEFKPMNRAQEKYVNMMHNNIITFGIGPAGTGKSYCAAAVAAEKLRNKEIDRIIITRPAVEAGESLGFLPGDMDEKFGPFIAPIVECLSKSLGKSYVEALVENEKIVFLPLAYMRGWTFERSMVILDEAQNITKTQMKLFLTRIGQDSTIVVDGDISQRDIVADGLVDAIDRLKGVPSVSVMRFNNDDIVRSGIVKDVILRYSDDFSIKEEDDYSSLQNYLSKE